MKFAKQNSYDIVRLFINNIGIAIFSVMLYSAAAVAAENYLAFAVPISVFSILFLCALLYYAGWDYGLKDKLSVEMGKCEYQKNRCLYMALWANVPLMALCALSALLLGLHMLSGVELFYTVFAIINAIMRFLLSTYIGTVQGVFAALSGNGDLYYLCQTILLSVLPALAVLATHLGYRSGLCASHLLGIFNKRRALSEKYDMAQENDAAATSVDSEKTLDEASKIENSADVACEESSSLS